MTSEPESTEPTQTYLAGHYTPVTDETKAFDLKVTGTLPPELTGRYLRNGPNPRPGEDPGHVFTGNGMLHGVRLRDGRAEWYRNRWVRTAKLAGAPSIRPDGTRDLAAVNANTHVIAHADKLFALVESGLPYEVTGELVTVGPCDFGGRLTTAMTAHPKEDPVTGELLFFGYGARPPYLTHHRLSAAGELVESREIEVPAGTMMHDFAITENYVVWLDLPVVFDPALLARGGMPMRWSDTYGARLGLMRRDAAGEVRWFDVDPCYIFHVGNAHEDAAGRVVLEAVRYSRQAFDSMWQAMGGAVEQVRDSRDWALGASQGGHVHRWLLDPATGRVSEEELDDRGVEMPTINDGRTGRHSRYLYTISENAIMKYDTVAGVGTGYGTGEGTAPGEAVFVPASDASDEDAGWLLSIVSHGPTAASELLVLDAHDLTRTATVELPRRVPSGFHGSWIPDTPHSR
ncbi:carotenoid oxygenase family protein [Streptomyces sp. HF10]|uniref:carotenoid oxygenase family protein n=1 Tax=Streptomyces sp. HF10 TaxID=2692233 RepID=UPI00131907EA|nr:carotenoid oxygenase family protein [Streptomyces sp. HF10]QHC33055.1 dioxygenase [Streptomyces sp. HF10]